MSVRRRAIKERVERRERAARALLDVKLMLEELVRKLRQEPTIPIEFSRNE